MTAERIIAQCLACNHKEELPDKPSGQVDCPKCGYRTSVYTSRQMSPEEIAAKYGPPNPVKRKVNRQTIKFTLPHLEARQAKEVQPMTQTAENRASFVPDKVEFLRQIAVGKSISKVERTWNMSPGSLHYWVGKWNLKGIKPERAQQLLDEMALDGQTQPEDKPAEQPVPVTEPLAEQTQADDATANEIKRLRDELAKALGERNQFQDLYSQVESENQALRAKIDRLHKETNDWRQAANDLKEKINGLTMEIEELNRDRQALLDTIEKAVSDKPKIGCLDVIEAATVNLTGACAFLVGSSIEQLWEFTETGEVTALQKTCTYIERLMSEVSA